MHASSPQVHATFVMLFSFPPFPLKIIMEELTGTLSFSYALGTGTSGMLSSIHLSLLLQLILLKISKHLE